jgi:hypothetical protein
MPAVSTPGSAPDNNGQRPEEAGPSDSSAAEYENQTADSVGVPDDAGLTAPVNEPSPHRAVFPLLDDSELPSGGLEDVIGTGLAGIADVFHPLGGLAATFSKLADFGPAGALASIQLPVPRIPNVGEIAGRSLLDGLAANNAALTALGGMRAPAFSLAESVAPVLGAAALLDGFNPAKALLPVMEPHITSVAKAALNSAVGLSGVARCLQPLGEPDAFARQMNSSLAASLAGLPPLLAPLPNLGQMIGPVVIG